MHGFGLTHWLPLHGDLRDGRGDRPDQNAGFILAFRRAASPIAAADFRLGGILPALCGQCPPYDYSLPPAFRWLGIALSSSW